MGHLSRDSPLSETATFNLLAASVTLVPRFMLVFFLRHSSKMAGVCVVSKFRGAIVELALSLLTSLSEVFPECAKTKQALEGVKSTLGDAAREEEFVGQWREAVRESRNDVAVLERLRLFQDIRAMEKWNDPEFAEDSKRHLLGYLNAMDALTHLYECMPKYLVLRVQQQVTPTAPVKKRQRKAAAAITANPLEAIGDVTTKLYKGLTPAERKDIERCIPELLQCLGKLGKLAPGASAEEMVKSVSQLFQCGDEVSGLLSGVSKLLNAQ
jgi:hypothetical protein